MAHDVFISYSSKDKPTADAVCATLESRGIRCWIAPRDVVPGEEYAAALVNALREARLMVLVFSSGANQSKHVLREVERAVSMGLPVVPLRIENVRPSAAMEYYIASRHWLDALTVPLERHLVQLAETVKVLLARMPAAESGAEATRAGAAGAPSGAAEPAVKPVPASTEPELVGLPVSQATSAPKVAVEAGDPARSGKALRVVAGVLIAAAVVAAAVEGIMKLNAYTLAKSATEEEAKLRMNPFPAGSHEPCDSPRNTSALDSLAPTDPAEQYRLGGQYESAESCYRAVDWYRKSGDQGYAPAQRALAYMFEQGMGVNRDMNQAFAWYRKAADGGDAEGEYKTGWSLDVDSGDVDSTAMATAVEWYRKAAEQDNHAAQMFVGFAYATGKGAARDDVEAYKWLSLSNNWGYDTPATLAELESRMTKGEISEAKQRVEEWKKAHGG
ncbi:MAG TPA: toll/interleukin-1 receptor domain-containing protein [Gemmatimonadaceae bacterium]|nr:toll/interleukin-1 receptor domain-containing protein [Gemmatimonadaceae bacterium]